MTTHDALSHADIARAWKDERFRAQLSDAQREALPAHPAGLIELTDLELDGIAGGQRETGTTLFGGTCRMWSLGCCGE